MAAYKWSAGAVKWLLDKCKATFLPKDQFKEAFLDWGGRDIIADISPIDASMSSLHSANRAELCNPNGVTIEYSRDGGETWIDYGANDADKVSLFSPSLTTSFTLGKYSNEAVDQNAQLRITMNASEMGFYTDLKKILIRFSSRSAKGNEVIFESSKKGTKDDFTIQGNSSIDGDTGWNSYRVITGATGGYNGQNENRECIRMTFKTNGGGYAPPVVSCIMVLGTTEWLCPSTIARTGHLYSYDWQGNATFPGNVQAKTLNGHTLQTDVPAGAKFTDTTYDIASKSADGLMSSGDKKKLDGLGKPTVFSNVQVAASAWRSGATAAGSVRTRYADVALSGVTANQFVQVVFSQGDIDSYNLASICTVGSGKITIYAETAPGGTMTIPTIVAWPA